MSESRNIWAKVKALSVKIGAEAQLRDGFRILMDERDRRYEQRFAAQERAVEKAETAQRAYNATTNEFRGQLDDQAKLLMPRSEAATQFGACNEKIEELKKEVGSLRETRSQVLGKDAKAGSSREMAMFLLGLAAALLAAYIERGH